MISDYGTVFVLLFGQGIYLKEETDKGLMDPNQFRSFGIQCGNNPTDIAIILAFHANDVFLLLCMQVTNFLVDFLSTQK